MTQSLATNTLSTRKRFSGKSVLVTGGAGGMGLAATRMFAEEGARIAILDIQKDSGDAVVSELQQKGTEAYFHHTDLSKPNEVDKAINAVIENLGGIDVLFNHAGTIIVKPFHENTDEDYDRLMDINLRSAFLVCRRVVTHMKDNGGGSIVVTASIGSERAFEFESIYCITKAAVQMLSKSIAVEYRNQGIRCNAVCPGFVKTAHGLREIDELDQLGQQWQDADLAATQVRICEAEEVASTVLFLASDEASFVNGASIYVDNGWFVKG